MGVLVTGAAGFIGAHLVRALASEGTRVVAVDCYLPDSYDPAIKRANARSLSGFPSVQLLESDVRHPLPDRVWRGITQVVNLAAMPGLAKSWQDFDTYQSCNVAAVHCLLEQSLRFGVEHFVQISTSSVYGRFAGGSEDSPLDPCSPYGVTKLAGERLVSAYGISQGLPFTILRYFSVYGPGQRPDMAYHRFIKGIMNDEEIVIYGDGSQSRSNTFVADIVDATKLTVEGTPRNLAFNVAGGECLELLQVIQILGELTARIPRVRFEAAQPGDQVQTAGSSERFSKSFGFVPKTQIRDGLAQQVEWYVQHHRA